MALKKFGRSVTGLSPRCGQEIHLADNDKRPWKVISLSQNRLKRVPRA